MRIPDKLLRAELSMLQDEIKMAQQMMENPITATMNAPRGKLIKVVLPSQSVCLSRVASYATIEQYD